MAALFVAEEWASIGNPMAVLNSQLASQSAEERETHCMVLKVRNKEEPEGHKVNIITPCFRERVEDKSKEPECGWLHSPETYFTQVSGDLDVGTIVGHFPVTSAAAFILKDTFFPNAKVILINHGILAPLSKYHVDEAVDADVVFSVGQEVFDHFSVEYRHKQDAVEHKLYLPRPDKVYFDLNIDYDEVPITQKRILTPIVGSEIDCKFIKSLAPQICETVKLFDAMQTKLPVWHVQSDIQLDPEFRDELINDSECGYLSVKITPPYGSQDDFCKELLQSYLCIIPPDESCGMRGLESIAAGLPVLAPKRSSVDNLITTICPDYASQLLYESTSRSDLSKKTTTALLDKQASIQIGIAKKLKQSYQDNKKISETHDEFFSHFQEDVTKRDSDLSVTAGVSHSVHEANTQEQQPAPQSDTKGTQSSKVSQSVHDEAYTQEQQPAPQSDIKENRTSKVSQSVHDEANTQEQQPAPQSDTKGTQTSKVSQSVHDEAYTQEQQPAPQSDTKGTKTSKMSGPFSSEKTFRVPIYDIWKRQVLDNVPDIYYARYLIDQPRLNPVFNTLRWEEFFYPAFLSYCHQNENRCSAPPYVTKATRYSITYGSPVYNNWERYVLDNVPNIHHARYLIEQLRFHPVFNMLRQEEFFYPAFMSYWQQKENLYSLPPTVTKATQYAIMHYFQINCKEHDLDEDKVWSSLQERFQEIGKVLYDNISEESVGKLYTSWFDSGILATELHGMVENCGDYYRFNSLFVYALIIACYVCADIKSGGKCLDQLMQDKMFNFLQNMSPYLYFYIPGILRDDAEIALLKEYTQRLLMKKDDVNVCLERLGYCLLESNCASELVTPVEVMVGQQILDLSNCTTVSNQSLQAFAVVIQNTSIIKEVVIHSEKEISTCSTEFKECIDKFLSEATTTNELSFVIRDQHEFISFVKLLRALPILKCFHNKSDSAHCYIPDMQSVQVTATSTIDQVDQCFVEMLVEALEWMPLLERFDLVKIGPVSSNILKCMANVKPKLSISMFVLAENELSFHDCEMIVKATSSMPYLRHLDLKNNNIGSVGCAALLPIKDYMEVIIDGNGVGKGLSDILKVACDQRDEPGISSNEIQTLVDFHQLQRSLDTVTKLDTSNVPHSCFEKFCDSLSLFTKTEHLICQSNKSVTLNELELLIASLHHLKNMTHFNINEIQVDMKFLEDFFISDDPSLSGQTSAMLFINKIFLSIQPSLTNLSICKSNICEVLVGESIKHLTNLVKLDLSHNKLSGNDLGNINIPDSIVSVNISHNSIESVNNVSFKHCLKLTDINMSHNEMQSPLKDILQTLPPTIQYCDVSNNNITDVSDVGKLLDNFQSIKHLNLGSNRFGAFGVHTLLNDITKYDMQSKIDVSHNFSCLYKYVRDQLSGMLAFPDIEKSNVMLNNKDLMFFIEIISRITRLHIKVPATFPEVDKKVLSCDLRLLQSLKHLTVNEIGDDDLEGILVCLHSLEKFENADFSKTGISTGGICTLFKFQHQHKTKPYINVAHNLTDLSAILPYIKDQLKSYSEDVDLDSDQLPVDQLKFCEEVCEITDVNLSYRYLGHSQGGKLCSGLKNLPRLRSMNLSFNDIGDYGAFTLSRGMQKGCFNLKHLDLSHNKISDIGVKILSLGLQETPDLEQLDLSYNDITDHGAENLGQAEVWMQNVTYLDLSHNGIGDKGAQSLGEGMGKISQLRHLDLGHNRIGDDGVVSLSAGCGRMMPCVLTYLDLSHNSINESGKESLTIAMYSINHLDLSHNQISKFGVESFSINDISWEELTYLDLSNNNILLDAASLSLDGIEKMVKLQHLNLSNNSIGDFGAECLSIAMEQMEDMTHVNLSHNQIGPTGAGHLGEGIKTMYQLTHLDLSNNKISDTGTSSFCESFTGESDQAILNTLVYLNLSNNKIGDSGAESVSEAVKTVNKLTQLDLSHNNIGNMGAECLSETIEILTNLTHLFLSHNNIGVSGADSLNREKEWRERSINIDLSHNDIET